MKSNVCELTNEKFDREILSEVEKCARYNGLEGKQALRLTLLAEELIGMLPNMVDGYTGRFWVENKDRDYELRVELKADYTDFETNESLLSVSSTGKNQAAKGVGGKIRSVVGFMLNSFKEANEYPDYAYVSGGMLGYEALGAYPSYNFVPGMPEASVYTRAWSLSRYKSTVNENAEEEWDELEKSVITKLADDVVVGIKGRQIDIIIKKKF